MYSALDIIAVTLSIKVKATRYEITGLHVYCKSYQENELASVANGNMPKLIIESTLSNMTRGDIRFQHLTVIVNREKGQARSVSARSGEKIESLFYIYFFNDGLTRY